MTRDDLIDFTKHLLSEDAATSAIATTANIQTTVDLANKKVWAEAVKQSPSLFEKRSGDLSYVAATGYYDLSTLESNAGLHLLTRAYIKSGDYYYVLQPFDPNERFRAGPEGLSVTPIGFYLEGEKLYLVPKPSQNQTLQLCYVANLATMSGSTVALGGVTSLTMFHPLVAYEAALTLGVKDEARITDLKLLRDELRRSLMQHLSRRQVRLPRAIREVPF